MHIVTRFAALQVAACRVGKKDTAEQDLAEAKEVSSRDC